MLSRYLVALGLAGQLPLLALAAVPEWIWTTTPVTDAQAAVFRHDLVLTTLPARAILIVAADNAAEVTINGQNAGKNDSWERPTRLPIERLLQTGTNSFLVRAKNDGGIAGLLLMLDAGTADKPIPLLVSDASWSVSPDGKSGWSEVRSLGAVGVAPWGDVLTAGAPPVAPAAESLKLLPGFRAELLRSAKSGEGSWVSMTIDPKGRLIVSPQGDESILRFTLDTQGQVSRVELLNLPIHGAMGLLYAFDALYVNGGGPGGYHCFRLRSSDGGETFGPAERLVQWQSGGNDGGPGEHGAHGIVKGPDGKLYIVCGNFVDVPGGIATDSPYQDRADDLALPRLEDGNGFGVGRKPPGGFVLRVDRDGSNPTLFAAGQRNTYDIAFNTLGELYGFDSDMEWDWGMPWYRATRIYQLVSGGDGGFREGSAKWPQYYPDSNPSVVDIGLGSPTGVRFGTGAKFPAKYQRALFAMDWSYGRILAVHLGETGTPASFEPFVVGKPLNVTDLEVGADGALYFTVGGRGTQSGLYRVSYVGAENTAAAPVVD